MKFFYVIYKLTFIIVLLNLNSCSTNSQDDTNQPSNTVDCSTESDVSIVCATIDGIPTIFDNVTVGYIGNSTFPTVNAKPTGNYPSNKLLFTIAEIVEGNPFMAADLYHDDGYFFLDNNFGSDITEYTNRRVVGTFSGSLGRDESDWINIENGRFTIYLP